MKYLRQITEQNPYHELEGTPSHDPYSDKEKIGGQFARIPDIIEQLRELDIRFEGFTENELRKFWPQLNVTPAEFARFVTGGFLKSKIQIYPDSGSFDNEVVVQVRLSDDNGRRFGYHRFNINIPYHRAYFGMMELRNVSDQGKGIGKRIIGALMPFFQRIGIERIEAGAGLEVGGYAWAKYGFIPDQNSWDSLRASINERIHFFLRNPDLHPEYDTPEFRKDGEELLNILDINDPHAIWAIADSEKYGKKLLLSTGWHAIFDARDPYALRRLQAYIQNTKPWYYNIAKGIIPNVRDLHYYPPSPYELKQGRLESIIYEQNPYHEPAGTPAPVGSDLATIGGQFASAPTPMSRERLTQAGIFSEYLSSSEEAEWNRWIREHWNEFIKITPEELRTIVTGGLSKSKVNMNPISDHQFNIEVEVRDNDNNQIGSHSFTVDITEREADMSSMVFNRSEQAKGHSKRIAGGLLPWFLRIGLKRVIVGAGLDRGGYTWARYGFVPNEYELPAIKNYVMRNLHYVHDEHWRHEIEKLLEINDTRITWAIADSPWGKQLLSGVWWHGEINVEDPNTMRRVQAYLMPHVHGAIQRVSQIVKPNIRFPWQQLQQRPVEQPTAPPETEYSRQAAERERQERRQNEIVRARVQTLANRVERVIRLASENPTPENLHLAQELARTLERRLETYRVTGSRRTRAVPGRETEWDFIHDASLRVAAQRGIEAFRQELERQASVERGVQAEMRRMGGQNG